MEKRGPRIPSYFLLAMSPTSIVKTRDTLRIPYAYAFLGGKLRLKQTVQPGEDTETSRNHLNAKKIEKSF